MQRRLSAILAADMVDYTRMMAENEAKTLGLIRELRDVYLEPAVIKAGGEIMKRMGDGWIIAFPTVHQLVKCTIGFQQSLAGHADIKLRTAAHIGEIVEDESDFYGAGVNLTQRLQTEAPPGGFLVSVDLLRQLPGEFSELFDDAGSFRLKGIPFPVDAYLWRPRERAKDVSGELPSISVEEFEYAPENSETRSIVSDLRHQLLGSLSRRTGVRVVDGQGGETVNCLYRLQGRLRMAQSKGRLNLSLLMGDSGVVAWSRQYEADAQDPFRFSDDLFERANADLRIQINAFDGSRLAALSDDELSVSELRTRAAQLVHDGTVSSHERARILLERAIVLSPEDAMSLAMHVEVVLFLRAAKHQELEPAELELLGRNIDRAVEYTPRSDYIRFVRALFSLWGSVDPEEAKKDIDRCLTINRNYPWGLMVLGLYHAGNGDFDEAIIALEQAIELSDSDPLLPLILYVASLVLYCAGKDRLSLEKIEHAIDLHPGQWAFFIVKSLNQQNLGEGEMARRSLDKARSLDEEPLILAPAIRLPESHSGLMEKLAPRSRSPGRT